MTVPDHPLRCPRLPDSHRALVSALSLPRPPLVPDADATDDEAVEGGDRLAGIITRETWDLLYRLWYASGFFSSFSWLLM